MEMRSFQGLNHRAVIAKVEELGSGRAFLMTRKNVLSCVQHGIVPIGFGPGNPRSLLFRVLPRPGDLESRLVFYYVSFPDCGAGDVGFREGFYSGLDLLEVWFFQGSDSDHRELFELLGPEY